MAYQHKIVLHCVSGNTRALDKLVEDFLRDRVKLVAVTGRGCARVEDIIDELVVGDGSDDSRYILTSSHPAEALAEVIQFAESLTGDYAGPIQVVEL